MTEKEVTPSQDTETPVEKSKETKSDVKKSKRHRTSDGQLNRVIIRRLPPTMTEEEFLNQIAPTPKFTAFYFASPDWTLGIMASTRAYITFEDPDEIYVFRDKYDGYVFVDAKGIEYSAVVEFAPFQGFSKTRSKKRDVKMNTMEADPHFIAFMEALKNAENETKTESKMEYSYQVKEDTEITSTPLLEYLENKKKEKIAERKRKADEKKKKRDEERQARKKQVAKNIPEPIKEEAKKDQGKQESRNETKDKDKKKPVEKKEKTASSMKVEPDDDGIMVRVVPSRLDRNQRKKEESDSRRDRDRDRNKSRRQGRDSKQGDKGGQDKNEHPSEKKGSSSEKGSTNNQSKEKEDTKRETKREKKPETDSSKTSKPTSEPKESKIQESGKREVKKYSERRKEIRARAENRRNEAEEKAVPLEQVPESLKTSSSLDVSAVPFVPNFKKPLESWVVKEGPPGMIEPFPKKDGKKDSNLSEDKPDSHVESESSAMENEKPVRQKLSKEEEEQQRKERAERISNLRNKDRPSIAIYQPRRVRIAANFNTAEGRETKVETPESDSKVDEKPLRERKHSKEEKRKSDKRRHHRSSGDEKTEKTTRRKKKSITEDEGREMSRQNSQASEATESRHDSGEDVDTNQESSGPKLEVTETISKAVEELTINDTINVEKDINIEDKQVSEVAKNEDLNKEQTKTDVESVDNVKDTEIVEG